ncbi:MAG TPA: MFS transporter [Pseudonocardiaceae bacterium]|nr:MFS transporter [Pseudonocardiaceae bacterium]
MEGDPKAAARVAIVIGVLFGLAGTGTSAVAVALPELALGLDVTVANAAWVISGYAVALAVLTAVHGRIADIVGVRGPLVLGVLLMAAGALVAAGAPTLPVLVAGRVLQGVGAAAVPVLGMALIGARWDGAVRAVALGRVTGAASVLSCLGPVLGGALDAAGGWRWTLVLPVAGLLALPVLRRAALPPAAGGSASTRRAWRWLRPAWCCGYLDHGWLIGGGMAAALTRLLLGGCLRLESRGRTSTA